MLAVEYHSCHPHKVNEAERMPRDILTNRDFLPGVAARAWRWTPETHEVTNSP